MNGINTKQIQEELDKLANPVLTNENGEPVRRPRHQYLKIKVLLDKGMLCRKGIREYEEGGVIGMTFRLNPAKIHTPNQLNEAVAWFKSELERENL